MKIKKAPVIATLVVAITALLFFTLRTKEAAHELLHNVRKSDFEVMIMTSGELRSKSNTRITAPTELQESGIYQIKIAEMVPEGTTVKEGEFVASLDNSGLIEKLNTQRLEIEKMNAEFTKAKLDTMLELRAIRDDIVNLRYDLKQKLLEKEQSKYEAPAEINRVQLDYEKSERALKQKEENYLTKKIQAQTKLQIIGSDMAQVNNRMNMLNQLMARLTIKAPKSGMVTYERNWNGQKRAVGSQIELWNNTVATLPDLTQMEVVTYVNEVDVQRVKVGQAVEVGLDASPEKKLKGLVRSVANIGEGRPNSDAKVFEVLIEVLTKDEDLRPSMTTSCKILAEKYADVVQIPLESLFADGAVSFVYKKTDGKISRQQVGVHTTNETAALVTNGLQPNDVVFLSQPTDTAGMVLNKIDLKNSVKPVQLIKTDSTLVKQLAAEAAKLSKQQAAAPTSGIIVIEN